MLARGVAPLRPLALRPPLAPRQQLNVTNVIKKPPRPRKVTKKFLSETSAAWRQKNRITKPKTVDYQTVKMTLLLLWRDKNYIFFTKGACILPGVVL